MEKIFVWNGYEMEKFYYGYGMKEILQNKIRKNRLPFHSIACPAKHYYSLKTREKENRKAAI